jgi:hypothetical protein
MNDDLKKFLEDVETPLSADAKAFLENRTPEMQIKWATINVPEGFLTPDDLSFSFKTSIGTKELPYSHQLNGALLRRHVRMDTPTKEAIRMGKLLLDNLRLPDAQFGKHYTDAVLWPVLDERFGHVELIRDTLDQMSHHDPYQGESLAECRKYLEDCVRGIGNSIVLELGYQEPTAFAVLAGAIYSMLDQRHHISARKVLFPK